MEIKPHQLTAREIDWVLNTDKKLFESITDKFANKIITESQYNKEMTNAFNELQRNFKAFVFVKKDAKKEREKRNKEIRNKFLSLL